jgi:hypothetical protein
MTRDRKAKKTTRARMAASGVSYLDARRADRDAERSGAAILSQQLGQEFHRRGWPVVVEHIPVYGQRLLYAGPLRAAIDDPTVDPDDDYGAELPKYRAPADRSAGAVSLAAPGTGEHPDFYYDDTLEPSAGAAAIVEAASAGLSAARGRALAQLTATDECSVCGEQYPDEHLMKPTSAALPACPACIFDGDLTMARAAPTALAFDLDRLLCEDLAAPAAWAAVTTLLTSAASPGLAERLGEDWWAHGTAYVPTERWSDPNLGWIWLPPTARRPGWLGGLGPGARPDVLVEALDAAHPALRAEFMLRAREDWDEEDEESEATERLTPTALALGWANAVTYAVALTTHAAEHPEMRRDWHVTESFDALDEHLAELGAETDSVLLETTLEAGLAVLDCSPAFPETRLG